MDEREPCWFLTDESIEAVQADAENIAESKDDSGWPLATWQRLWGWRLERWLDVSLDDATECVESLL